MSTSRAISSTWPTTQSVVRTMRAKLLVDIDHYDDLVMRAVAGATVSVWISTANVKTMLIEAPIGSTARARGRYVSFFESLGELARRGVDVCVLHASPPSRPLVRELARLGESGVKLRRCPRVHMKMIAIDGRLLYLGSANLTGAGLGAKGTGRRNFEMGIVTDSEAMLDAAQGRFDQIWRGAECGGCKLRGECEAPLDQPRRINLPIVRANANAKSRKTAREPSHAVVVPTSRGSSTRTRRSPSSPR